MKPKVALVRGKFLNQYEMQSYEPLADRYAITGIGSRYPFHDKFAFPTVKLWSPMDLPAFPYKMPILNRLCIDAHYLWGLENALSGFDIAHSAETYYHYTKQCLDAKRDGNVKAVVVTVLETIAFNNEGIWGRKRMKERARKEVDHFIAISKRAKDALIAEGTDPHKITVIPYGIDTHRFKSVAKKNSPVCTMLFVGRLEKEKGVLDLLEAFGNVVGHEEDLGKTLQLMIVGSGSLQSEILRRAKSKGLSNKVTVTTASYEEMPRIYKIADVFVAPSKSTNTWEEQYNIALLEAQSSGLAIITTRSGAIPENVGSAAVLIPEDNVEELTASLYRIISNQSFRKSLEIASRKRAETVHDRDIVSKKIDVLYEKVLGK